ncbi:MAG: GNAT family N-acetyltransferase [Candidatus Babeliales bacterium]
MSILRSKLFQITLFTGCLLALTGGVMLYMHQHQEQPKKIVHVRAPVPVTTGIVDFNYQRDHDYVNAVFEDDENWYWLVDGSRSDFSPEDMMKTMSASRDLSTKGDLIMKMLYVEGKPAGFSAYYNKNFYLGKIRFIYVDPAFRGAGYGLQLVNAAVDDLKARGANKIALVTRSSNLPAQRIYEKAGFTLQKSPEGFAEFTKVIG